MDKSDFVNLFQFVATTDNTPYYCVPAALNFRQNICGGEEAIYNYIRDIAQRGADLLAMLLGTEVMDDMDSGYGLRTMGSYEASDKRDGGRIGWSGGIRDCAMANVLLPITIVDGHSRGSISMGPGGAGSAGGLSPALRTPSSGFAGPGLASQLRSPSTGSGGLLLGEPVRSSSPLSIGGSISAGPTIIQAAEVPIHVDWMQKTLVDEFNTFVAIYEYDGKLWTRISGQIYLELKDFEWLGGVLKSLCERVKSGESLRGRSRAPDAEKIELEALSLKTPVPSRHSTGKSLELDISPQVGW
jgi:hypothetical protein